MDAEKPIEKLLRQTAAHRRQKAGAPLELDGATRRLLQEEIARKYRGQPSRPSSLMLILSHWWPRLAVACGLLVLAALATWQWAPSRANQRMAANKTPLPPAANSLPAETRSALEAVQSLEVSQALSQSEFLPVNAAPTNLPGQALGGKSAEGQPIVAANQPANLKGQEQIPLDTASVQDAFRRRYGLTAAPGAAVAANEEVSNGTVAKKLSAESAEAQTAVAAGAQSKDGEVRTSDSLKADSGEKNARQRFSQVPLNFAPERSQNRLLDATPASPVLTSFEVEQNGNELRVVDNDGSVYAGQLQPSQSKTKSTLAAPAKSGLFKPPTSNATESAAAKFSATPPTGPGLYFFRVVGTNQSLNQRVEFTGNVMTPSNTLSPALFNSRISGRARVGDKKEFPVNAVPAQP